ncbi:MAG: hypothetical protein HYZ21_04635 [Chloroflexi bacterium]|nr:hypothetical protein [Chloroflexota bacterium]
MNTQTLTNLARIFDLVIALPPTDLPIVQPVYASSLDYGFDFDEDEVGRELLAPLPASLEDQSISDEDTDEFALFYF